MLSLTVGVAAAFAGFAAVLAIPDPYPAAIARPAASTTAPPIVFNMVPSLAP
jgi:hypothetical protein